MRLRSADRGFTLVELVAVLVVLGIIAAVASFRFAGGRGAVAVGPEADVLVSRLRLAQTLAMTRGARHCLNLTAGAHRITHTNCGTNAALPAGDVNPLSFDASVTATWTNLPSALVSFDTLGRPATDAAGTLLAATATITLSGPDGATTTVTIAPQTGRAVRP